MRGFSAYGRGYADSMVADVVVGYGLVGILVLIALVLLIIYLIRRV